MATVNLAAASPAANDFAHLVNALAEVRNCYLDQIHDFVASNCQEVAGRPTGARMHDFDYALGCELRDHLNHVDEALRPHLQVMTEWDFIRVMTEADAERGRPAA